MVLVLAMVCEAADGAILPFCWADMGDLAVPLAFFAIVAEYLAGGDGSQRKLEERSVDYLDDQLGRGSCDLRKLQSVLLAFAGVTARNKGPREGQGQSFTAGRDCLSFEKVVVMEV